MTYQGNFTLPTELADLLIEQGFDYLPELIRVLVNASMQAERQKHLGVDINQVLAGTSWRRCRVHFMRNVGWRKTRPHS